MKIIKETKYLRFIDLEDIHRKTKVIAIVNIHHDEHIGFIKWFSRWRQYCFYPSDETIWNSTCLNDVNEVIGMLMNERNSIKPELKTIGVIAYTIEDFQQWRKSKNHRPYTHQDTARIYIHKGKKYICLSRPEHCCGYMFDEVIETSRASLNKLYHSILTLAKPSLKPGSKLLGKKV